VLLTRFPMLCSGNMQGVQKAREAVKVGSGYEKARDLVLFLPDLTIVSASWSTRSSLKAETCCEETRQAVFRVVAALDTGWW
jgi:hypothetical protein